VTQTEYEDFGSSGFAELRNRYESEDVVVTVEVQVYGDWSIVRSNFDQRWTTPGRRCSKYRCRDGGRCWSTSTVTWEQ
jgi:hypothetical protein